MGIAPHLEDASNSDLEQLYMWRFDHQNYDAFYTFPNVNVEQFSSWMTSNLNDKSQKNFVLKTTEGQLIGTISLLNIDNHNKRAEVGRVLLGENEFKGKGFAKNMMKELHNYAFNELGLEKLYLEVFEDNLPACGLYKSCGYEQEGLLKKHIFKDGYLHGKKIKEPKWHNILVMSIFKKS